MEAVVDPGAVILDDIAALEVERARVEAKIATRMLDFADVRREQAQAAPSAMVRDLEVSFAADELGLVLHQPTRTVQCRLAEARRVRGLLPNTWLAHLDGRVDAYRISLIASAADKLGGDQHAIIELDHRVGAYAAAHTASQTKAWLRRFVARNAPSTVVARAEMAQRSVWVDHHDDGMSWLHAYLPTPDAVRIDHLLTAEAKKLPAGDRSLDTTLDTSLDTLRADLFVKHMLTTGDGTASSRALLAVTVPVTSLAGVSDQPGVSFDGQFALPADLVRDLAHEPGTLFYRVMTDPVGRILDVTELGRFPTHKLRVAVQARDGTCTFPTCSRPATESDLDHKVPRPRGPTNGDNLRALCRRHHRIKTHLPVEPDTLSMRARQKPSRLEHDLTTWLVNIELAA